MCFKSLTCSALPGFDQALDVSHLPLEYSGIESLWSTYRLQGAQAQWLQNKPQIITGILDNVYKEFVL